MKPGLEKWKSLYHELRRRHPFLADFSYRAYHGGLIRSVKYRLRGSGHILSIHRSAVLKNVRIELDGKSNTIEIGPECTLSNVGFFLKGDFHRIVLGKRVRFFREGSLCIEDKEGEISFGEGTTVMDAHFAVTGMNRRIHVGSHCMFAYDIDVRTGDSHAILDLQGCKLNHENDVTIGDHVWVAAHCGILKGAVVPPDSVVATRSVVTKAFDHRNVLIGGCPAQILKEGISWSWERFPEKTQ